jgi:hypothetical protein
MGLELENVLYYELSAVILDPGNDAAIIPTNATALWQK